MTVNRIYEVPGPGPDERQSDAELDALYAAITGRQPFRYRAQDDPLYRSYADRYIQNGRLAMRDSMGQGAALTGGYGSSYAQSVGQQQYNEYLRSLGEVLPELYGLAWQRYSAEGEQLQNAYDLAWQRRENEYQRGRDALSDERYAAEQELEQQRWDAQQAAAEEKTAYQRQSDAYKRLYQLIFSSGYEPTDEELEAAGLTREQAEALRYEYLRANKLLPGAGGGGGYARGSSGKKKTKNKTAAKTTGSLGGGLLGGALLGAQLGLTAAGSARAAAPASTTNPAQPASKTSKRYVSK